MVPRTLGRVLLATGIDKIKAAFEPQWTSTCQLATQARLCVVIVHPWCRLSIGLKLCESYDEGDSWSTSSKRSHHLALSNESCMIYITMSRSRLKCQWWGHRDVVSDSSLKTNSNPKHHVPQCFRSFHRNTHQHRCLALVGHHHPCFPRPHRRQ